VIIIVIIIMNMCTVVLNMNVLFIANEAAAGATDDDHVEAEVSEYDRHCSVLSRFCLLYCSVTSEISECEFQMTAAKCLLRMSRVTVFRLQ